MTTPAEELRTAAQTLREVAPEITGRVAGLADPVADWLDEEATHLDNDDFPAIHQPALAVARAINGGQPT